ncbi:MAG: hypothetical protein ACYCYF_00095 [Anaerolineae bacterium]
MRPARTPGDMFLADSRGVMLKRRRYRIWQGLAHLRAVICPSRVALECARQHLSEAEWGLFGRMSPGDQDHAICVLLGVQRLSTATAALTKAALLHDVGKAGAGLNLGRRAVIVVLGALGLLDRVASQNANSWRHPFYLHLHHAERGAQLCADAGCAPEVVALVRWHDTNPESVPDQTAPIDLVILQAADDAC